MQISGTRPWLSELVLEQLAQSGSSTDRAPDLTGCHAQVLELSADRRRVTLYDGAHTIDGLLTARALNRLDETAADLGPHGIHGRVVAPIDAVLVPDLSAAPPRVTFVLRELRVFADSLAHRPVRTPAPVVEHPDVLRALRAHVARHLADCAAPPPAVDELPPIDELEGGLDEHFARDVDHAQFPPASLRLEEVLVPGPSHAARPAAEPPTLRIPRGVPAATGQEEEMRDDDRSTVTIDDDDELPQLYALTPAEIRSQSEAGSAPRSQMQKDVENAADDADKNVPAADEPRKNAGEDAQVENGIARLQIEDAPAQAKGAVDTQPSTLDTSQVVIAAQQVTPDTDMADLPDLPMTQHYPDDSEESEDDVPMSLEPKPNGSSSGDVVLTMSVSSGSGWSAPAESQGMPGGTQFAFVATQGMPGGSQNAFARSQGVPEGSQNAVVESQGVPEGSQNAVARSEGVSGGNQDALTGSEGVLEGSEKASIVSQGVPGGSQNVSSGSQTTSAGNQTAPAESKLGGVRSQTAPKEGPAASEGSQVPRPGNHGAPSASQGEQEKDAFVPMTAPMASPKSPVLSTASPGLPVQSPVAPTIEPVDKMDTTATESPSGTAPEEVPERVPGNADSEHEEPAADKSNVQVEETPVAAEPERRDPIQAADISRKLFRQNCTEQGSEKEVSPSEKKAEKVAGNTCDEVEKISCVPTKKKAVIAPEVRTEPAIGNTSEKEVAPSGNNPKKVVGGASDEVEKRSCVPTQKKAVIASESVEEVRKELSMGNTAVEDVDTERMETSDKDTEDMEGAEEEEISQDTLFMESTLAKGFEKMAVEAMFTFDYLEERRKAQPWEMLLADYSVLRESKAAQTQSNALKSSAPGAKHRRVAPPSSPASPAVTATGAERLTDRDVDMDAGAEAAAPGRRGLSRENEQKHYAALMPDSAPF